MFTTTIQYYLFILFIELANTINGYRILCIMHTPSPSHHIFNRELNLELVKRGHEVTVISADEEKYPPAKNYRHYVIEDLYKIKELFNYEMLIDQSYYKNSQLVFDWEEFVCTQTMKSKTSRTIRQLAKNETFDLIVYESGLVDCSLGYLSDFNYPPTVGIAAFGWAPWISWYSGIPEDYQFIPPYLADYEAPLTFWQKIDSFFFNWYTLIYYRWVHLPKMMALGREVFGDDMPDLDTVLRNTSLFLVNVNIARDYPRPISPDVITIGGLHLKKGNALSKDLQKWMDEATDGVILFSLGTNVRSDQLSKEKIDMFLKTFGKLKEKVLWKYESELENVPSNVKILKWVPQGDLFDHPNARLFITHGGGMSSNEAIYHGIPVVLIPIFCDQSANADRLHRREMGIRVFFDEMLKDEHYLYNVIRKVIDEPRYKQRAKELQAIYKDEPVSPLNKTIYWLEYVVRHKGAKHLRLASRDLTWYQMGHFDLLPIFLLILCLFGIPFYKIYNKILTKKLYKTKEKKT